MCWSFLQFNSHCSNWKWLLTWYKASRYHFQMHNIVNWWSAKVCARDSHAVETFSHRKFLIIGNVHITEANSFRSNSIGVFVSMLKAAGGHTTAVELFPTSWSFYSWEYFMHSLCLRQQKKQKMCRQNFVFLSRMLSCIRMKGKRWQWNKYDRNNMKWVLCSER